MKIEKQKILNLNKESPDANALFIKIKFIMKFTEIV